MKTTWQMKPVGEAFRVVNGGTPKTGVAAYWDGQHHWITPAEMGELPLPYLSASRRRLTDEGLRVGAELVPANSIILSTRAPIGHLVINEVPMAFNQGCKGLVPLTGVDTKFAYYFLLANVPLLESLGSGATFKELSGGKLKEVPFSFPSLSEQRRIATILDAAFEGIAAARANAEKNLQNTRELFDTFLANVFAQHGDIVQLAHCAEAISDGDHAPPPKAPTGVPFITISNVDKETRRIDFSDTFAVSRDYFDGLKPHRKPRNGDVLYTVTGSFGIPILVEDEGDFCFQRHIGLIRPKSDIDSRWLMYALLSPQVRAQAEAGATGTAQKTVSLGTLRAMTIPKVGLEEQRRLAGQVDVMYRELTRFKDTAKAKLAALDELKQSLLKQALTGQLTSAKAMSVAAAPRPLATSPEFSATIIALHYERHRRRQRENTCGRVKGQKILHLAEARANLDLGRQPIKDAAGPNDSRHMRKAEAWAKQNDFFEMIQRDTGGYDFKPLSGYNALIARAPEVLGESLARIEAVIDLVVPLDTKTTEVLATVYAAWNNLLMDGAAVSEETIVRAAREDWHPDKLAIPVSKFREAIAFIRFKGLEPDGSGKYVGGQHQLGI